MTDHRCRRGDRCPDYARDEHGRKLGAAINAEDGLCDTCTTRAERAIRELPEDYLEMELALAKGAADTEGKVRGTRELPVPLRMSVEACQAQMAHEALCWAESVAEKLRVDFDTQKSATSRPGANLARSCALLASSMSVLLALRDVEHLVWVDGRMTDVGFIDDHWAYPTRDGIDGALVLNALHHRSRMLLGKTKLVHDLPVPCPRCQRMSLQRVNGSDTVECQACSRRYTFEEYEKLCLIIARSRENA